jgi:glycerophosphoryl diester phosphodiesterase
MTYKGRPILDARLVRAAHQRNLPVHVWTIDDPETMHHLLDIGVDGIFTDRPSVLKEVLIDRDQWVE